MAAQSRGVTRNCVVFAAKNFHTVEDDCEKFSFACNDAMDCFGLIANDCKP
jgi:hypothetical protein